MKTLELGAIALEIGFALPQLGPDRTVIERKQEIALLDLLALLEMDLGDLAIDARLDHHGGDRLDGADRADLDRCVHLDHDIGHDGLARRRPRHSGFGRRFKKEAAEVISAREENDE